MNVRRTRPKAMEGIEQTRLFIAERLMLLAMVVIPKDTKEANCLAEAMIHYMSNTMRHMDDRRRK